MSEKRREFDYLLPPEECDRVYEVLAGEPDLDPCGHPEQFLRAKRVMYGTNTGDDGMLTPWAKKSVFLNAPHGEREPKVAPDFAWYPYTKWITKASLEAQRGASVVAFMPASTDRRWFHNYVSEATSIALLEQRVKCYVPDRSAVDAAPTRGAQPMTPHMVVLWTSDADTAERFFSTYKDRGMIVEPRPLT